MLEQNDRSSIFDNDSQLTGYLIHSGELQPFVDNPLTDVEINVIHSPRLDIDNVQLKGTSISMEGTFTVDVDTNIHEFAYGEDYGNEVTISKNGHINVQFEIDLEKVEDYFNDNTINLSVGGFDITDVIYHDNDDSGDLDNEDLKYCTGCGEYKGRGQLEEQCVLIVIN